MPRSSKPGHQSAPRTPDGELTIVDRARKTSPRIPHARWEALKLIIVNKYETSSLHEVMHYMEQQHDFAPTKRQYVHRLLKIWNISKYKRETPASRSSANPSTPSGGDHRLDTPLSDGLVSGGHTAAPSAWRPSAVAVQELPVGHFAASGLLSPPAPAVPPLLGHGMQHLVPEPHHARGRLQNLWLADVALALGYTHCSFDINCMLWSIGPPNTHIEVHTVACVRTAQDQVQVERAREIAKAYLKTWPRFAGHWDTSLWDLVIAHTFSLGIDAGNGLEQVARAILDIIEDNQGQDDLKVLSSRGLLLDIPVYLFLRAALTWYYEEPEGAEIDVSRVLKQFIDQQLAFTGGNIGSLLSCLGWCIDMLSRGPPVPLDVPETDGNPRAEAYIVLCGLWKLCVDEFFEFPWACVVEQQLGIRATELLATVVCMSMAAAPPGMAARGRAFDTALAGARNLNALRSEDLVHRFLGQLWATNGRLFPQLRKQYHPSPSDGVVRPMMKWSCTFVTERLGIPGPPFLGAGEIGFPLVLAGLDEDSSSY